MTMNLDEAKMLADRELSGPMGEAARVLRDALRSAEDRSRALEHITIALTDDLGIPLPRGVALMKATSDVCRAINAVGYRLRSAEGQVAAIREQAAQAVDKALAEVSDGVMPVPSALTFANVVAARIRSLPAPAARTYEEGVRDAAKACERVAEAQGGPYVDFQQHGAYECATAVLALLSPASAPTPGVAKAGVPYLMTTDGTVHDAAGNRIGSVPVDEPRPLNTFPAPTPGLIATPIVLPDGSRGWRVGLNGQEATYTDKDGAPHARIDPPAPKAFDAEAAFAELARGLTEHHNLVLHAPTHLNLPPWNLGEAIARARKAGSGS